ncbi:ribonuclease HII [Natronorarus salvus]|uniref:ribonuclease HII n=1 Tax=Natronorarus salvus TaxID=3117733 RepID=UPI003908111F
MRFGADEAGRGPVLGPMVAAAVAVDGLELLPEEIDDSKRLTPTRRESLSKALGAAEGVEIGISVVPVERIDDPETDMNTLTVEAQTAAIGEVVAGGERGIVDACDTDPERFARRVGKRLPADVSLVAEHGADARHREVAAASVVAKVERDERIGALTEEYGPVGSGYPGDPATREFLARVVDETGDLPACARRSWSTCEDVLAAARQRALSEFV